MTDETGGCDWQAMWDLAFPPAENISAQLAASEPPEQPAEVAPPVVEPPQNGVSAAQPVSGHETARPVPELAEVIQLHPRQCTATATRTGQRCQHYPMLGSTVCDKHGGKSPNALDKAARNVQEQRAAELARKMIGEVDLAAYDDPFAALSFVTSYSFAFTERMARIVEALPDAGLRYEGKLGEHIRGEVTALQKALADTARITTDALRLGLAERRVRVEESKIDLVEKALMAAFRATGLDEAGQRQTRRALRLELRAVTTDA